MFRYVYIKKTIVPHVLCGLLFNLKIWTYSSYASNDNKTKIIILWTKVKMDRTRCDFRTVPSPSDLVLTYQFYSYLTSHVCAPLEKHNDKVWCILKIHGLPCIYNGRSCSSWCFCYGSVLIYVDSSILMWETLYQMFTSECLTFGNSWVFKQCDFGRHMHFLTAFNFLHLISVFSQTEKRLFANRKVLIRCKKDKKNYHQNAFYTVILWLFLLRKVVFEM